MKLVEVSCIGRSTPPEFHVVRERVLYTRPRMRQNSAYAWVGMELLLQAVPSTVATRLGTLPPLKRPSCWLEYLNR